MTVEPSASVRPSSGVCKCLVEVVGEAQWATSRSQVPQCPSGAARRTPTGSSVRIIVLSCLPPHCERRDESSEPSHCHHNSSKFHEPLNDRPRQTLGWMSPSQALDEVLR